RQLLHATYAITRNQLYFSDPRTFNDPFDCRPNFFLGSEERLIRTICKRENITYEASFLDIPEIEKIFNIKEYWDNALSNTAVCCFSADDRNPIMWAHYANNHKGLCLIYEPLDTVGAFIAFPVKYSEERPKVDYSRLDEPFEVMRGILTKSTY